jgi:hypothetical protein
MAYISYVEVLRNRGNAVERIFCGAINKKGRSHRHITAENDL